MNGDQQFKFSYSLYGLYIFVKLAEIYIIFTSRTSRISLGSIRKLHNAFWALFAPPPPPFVNHLFCIYLKRINFSTVLILVPCLGTKISTVQKLVWTIIVNLKSVFKSKQKILKHD